jgi:thioester reductase-like protein
MPTVLFTGFPGFLGSELLPRVLDRSPEHRALCLVQPKFAALALERAERLAEQDPSLAGRIGLVEGDICRPGLGLTDPDGVAAGVEEIFHLAAVYDLSVGRDLAVRVNVEGTRNVLEIARRAPRLRRLQYVSTCYVSGRHPGLFTERDLEVGQRFNNFYEETKFLAEVEVQQAMRDGLPVSIYRPSIVVGDSRTGTTQKYDGPYFAIRWLLRQPGIAIFPIVGDPRATEFNVVPRDFVIDAIAHLSALEEASGGVFQLADPAPMTVDGMLRILAEASGRRIVRVPLPLAAAKRAIDHVPGVYRLMGIPSSAVDYMVHPTRYGTDAASALLEPAGITVPPFASYAARLVGFVRANPEIGAAAMA